MDHPAARAVVHLGQRLRMLVLDGLTFTLQMSTCMASVVLAIQRYERKRFVTPTPVSTLNVYVIKVLTGVGVTKRTVLSVLYVYLYTVLSGWHFYSLLIPLCILIYSTKSFCFT